VWESSSVTADAQELRALQAPLKERYRSDPEAAVVTLRARATLGEGVSCSVDTGRAIAVAGLAGSCFVGEFASFKHRFVTGYDMRTVSAPDQVHARRMMTRVHTVSIVAKNKYAG